MQTQTKRFQWWYNYNQNYLLFEPKQNILQSAQTWDCFVLISLMELQRAWQKFISLIFIHDKEGWSLVPCLQKCCCGISCSRAQNQSYSQTERGVFKDIHWVIPSQRGSSVRLSIVSRNYSNVKAESPFFKNLSYDGYIWGCRQENILQIMFVYLWTRPHRVIIYNILHGQDGGMNPRSRADFLLHHFLNWNDALKCLPNV